MLKSNKNIIESLNVSIKNSKKKDRKKEKECLIAKSQYVLIIVSISFNKRHIESIESILK